MKWSIEIEKVNSGYIITPHEDSEGEKTIIEIPDGDETLSEMEAFQKLAWNLRNFFAVYNDKHAGKFLEITIEGDKE